LVKFNEDLLILVGLGFRMKTVLFTIVYKYWGRKYTLQLCTCQTLIRAEGTVHRGPMFGSPNYDSEDGLPRCFYGTFLHNEYLHCMLRKKKAKLGPEVVKMVGGGGTQNKFYI
jgi:hypothetical protein